jgi:hypothetical protein
MHCIVDTGATMRLGSTSLPFRRHQGCTRAAKLTAAMWPYLPILRVFVLLPTAAGHPAQRDRLIQRIEAAVRSVD